MYGYCSISTWASTFHFGFIWWSLWIIWTHCIHKKNILFVNAAVVLLLKEPDSTEALWLVCGCPKIWCLFFSITLFVHDWTLKQSPTGDYTYCCTCCIYGCLWPPTIIISCSHLWGRGHCHGGCVDYHAAWYCSCEYITIMAVIAALNR